MHKLFRHRGHEGSSVDAVWIPLWHNPHAMRSPDFLAPRLTVELKNR